MSQDPQDGEGHAAGRPSGIAGRAWVREGSLGKDKPNAKWPAGRSRGRTVYILELPGGAGCLRVSEDGTHRVSERFSPPEGDDWTALHDEWSNAQAADIAGQRHAAKQERKRHAAVKQAESDARVRAARRVLGLPE